MSVSECKKTRIQGMFHIGRKVPKGFVELAGGIHLGRGTWILPMKPREKENHDQSK